MLWILLVPIPIDRVIEDIPGNAFVISFVTDDVFVIPQKNAGCKIVLPDSDSQSGQLFGLLVEECGDPRYGSVSKTKGRTIRHTL